MKKTKIFIKLYIVALITFLIIDIPWISLFANSFYHKHLDSLLADTPNMVAAILFYLMFIAGLVFFAVRPGLKHNSLLPGIFKSAFYGLITYGTYDLTNLALIKEWPLSVTIIDMIWGVSVSVVVGVISMVFGKRMTIHGS